MVGNAVTLTSDSLAVEAISAIEIASTDAALSVEGSVAASVGQDVVADVRGLSLGASGSVEASVVDSVAVVTGQDSTGVTPPPGV